MTTQPAMQSPEEMAEYLFKSNQINKFIEHYNKVSRHVRPGHVKSKLRIETHSPYIYVIVVNKPTIKINGKETRLVKVGFTQVSVEKDTNNRMEKVVKEIKQSLETEYKLSDAKLRVSILFVFLIHPLDTRPFREVEIAIREKVGFPLPKAKAKEWGLPVPTEWALTTQAYINKIKDDVKDLKDENEVISTKIFKSEPGKRWTRCNLPGALNMTQEELTENLKELPFPFEKVESPAYAKKATKKTMTTPENSTTAGGSSTPAAQTPGKTSTTAAKGSGKKPSATHNLPATLNTTFEDFTEMFKECSLENDDNSASAKKTTENTTTTPEKSPPAGESSTPEASATQTPGKSAQVLQHLQSKGVARRLLLPKTRDEQDL